LPNTPRARLAVWISDVTVVLHVFRAVYKSCVCGNTCRVFLPVFSRLYLRSLLVAHPLLADRTN